MYSKLNVKYRVYLVDIENLKTFFASNFINIYFVILEIKYSDRLRDA